MTTLTETLHAGGFIVSEANGRRSRDQVTIALSQTLVTAQVIGRSPLAAVITSSAAADASNTGSSGAITLDVTTPVLADAKNGVYRAVCIEPATNSGTFEVFDPKGAAIGKVLVGATFANQIKFVIADATDFVPGDAFSITVGIENADYEWKAYDPTATDGAEYAAGVLFDAVTTDGSTKKQGVAMRRSCELRASDLVWPVSITAPQKAAAIIALEDLGIVLR
jgi:Bacteriophage lambda head decoration protein D